MRAFVREAVLSTLLVAEYWAPMALGGDYSAGNYRFTPLRAAALGLLAGLVCLGLVLARFLEARVLVVGPALVLASAAVVALSLFVSSAWVHVPPDAVLLGAVAVAGLPFLRRLRPRTAIVTTAIASGLVTFSMACFRPY